ncbi:MAG TPA: hypothetical protein VHQ22_02290 [Terriglobales bacterium]|nr:hypothetical protein [Terriglobales bacterium]
MKAALLRQGCPVTTPVLTYAYDYGTIGSTSFAGITNAFSYNKRLQPLAMSASSPSQTVFSIGYDFHLSAGDNGNVIAESKSTSGWTNYVLFDGERVARKDSTGVFYYFSDHLKLPR